MATAFQNVIPTREQYDYYLQNGWTQYEYDDIVATAQRADALNKQYIELLNKLYQQAIPEGQHWAVTANDSHVQAISDIERAVCQVSISGSRGGKEAWPLKRAIQDIRVIEKSITSLESLRPPAPPAADAQQQAKE